MSRRYSATDCFPRTYTFRYTLVPFVAPFQSTASHFPNSLLSPSSLLSQTSHLSLIFSPFPHPFSFPLSSPFLIFSPFPTPFYLSVIHFLSFSFSLILLRLAAHIKFILSTYMHTQTRMHRHMHTYAHTHVYKYIYTHMVIYTCGCMYINALRYKYIYT